jgi:23S rRNA (pseudouridine1915-N3)-methyltransferase
MKITLLTIGKTDDEYIKTGIAEYSKRINRYTRFSVDTIPDVRRTSNLPEALQKEAEGDLILKKGAPGKEIHLFDEHGTMLTSREFASFIERKMVSGLKELILVIGGPYGFAEKVCLKANSRISLSKLTFSHQLVRILCTEQIYRAFTILNNEPYHHD